jgi:serine acetyltransferase
VIVEDNSYVGASSLVGKNVDKKTKVFGVPARKIQNL